jgi:hypothetical protein
MPKYKINFVVINDETFVRRDVLDRIRESIHGIEAMLDDLDAARPAMTKPAPKRVRPLKSVPATPGSETAPAPAAPKRGRPRKAAPEAAPAVWTDGPLPAPDERR